MNDLWLEQNSHEYAEMCRLSKMYDLVRLVKFHSSINDHGKFEDEIFVFFIINFLHFLLHETNYTN